MGRAHLKRWLDDTLRQQFTGTSHHLGNHIIEFDDPDHAHGVVYSKNEHETPTKAGGSEWVIMQMLYWDNYERIDGCWYFRRRLPCYWYATDINKPPVGDDKMRWPDRSSALIANVHWRSVRMWPREPQIRARSSTRLFAHECLSGRNSIQA